MSDDVVIGIVIIVIALIILVWLLRLAAGLVLVFTGFVMELPLIISVLMFILFPPTLIVFLVGLAFVHFGVADRVAGSDSDQSHGAETAKLSKLDIEEEKERRRALGYEE